MYNPKYLHPSSGLPRVNKVNTNLDNTEETPFNQKRYVKSIALDGKSLA